MLEEIDEPPPVAGGFDGDRRVGREFGEELLQTRDIVGKPLLRDFAVFGQDRDLRTAFVQVDAHVYHLLGLLSQRGLRPTLRSQPISGRSEEHTSELQSHLNLVCRLLLEKTIRSPTT